VFLDQYDLVDPVTYDSQSNGRRIVAVTTASLVANSIAKSRRGGGTARLPLPSAAAADTAELYGQVYADAVGER